MCPLATKLKSKVSAASSLGSEPCVFTRRRNSSCSLSMTLLRPTRCYRRGAGPEARPPTVPWPPADRSGRYERPSAFAR
jgi:hypothetical protein